MLLIEVIVPWTIGAGAIMVILPYLAMIYIHQYAAPLYVKWHNDRRFSETPESDDKYEMRGAGFYTLIAFAEKMARLGVYEDMHPELKKAIGVYKVLFPVVMAGISLLVISVIVDPR